MLNSALQHTPSFERIRGAFARNNAPATLLCGRVTSDDLQAIASLGCPIVSVIGRQALAANGATVANYGWYCEESCTLNPPAKLAQRIIVLGEEYELGARIAVHLVKNGARWFEFAEVSRGAVSFLYREFTKALARRAGATPLARVARWHSRKEACRTVCAFSEMLNPEDKVVFAIGSLGPGGSERQLTLLLRGLRQNDCIKSELLVERDLLPPHDFFAASVAQSGVPIKCLGSVELHLENAGTSEQQRCLKSVAKTFGIPRHRMLQYYHYFVSSRPKVVHLWLDDVNVVGGLAALIAGVPKIVLGCRSLAPYNFSLNQPHFRDVYRLLLSSSKVVMLNNSRAGAADYAKWCGVPESRVRVVNNGFDFSELCPEGEALPSRDERTGRIETRLVVGSVMRLSEEKRPMFWLEIAEELHRLASQIRFVIYGEGPMRVSMETFIKSRGLADAVILPGPTDDAVGAISKMDLFLLTSRAEGLPNVLIEAQAVGVPVAAFNVGGVPECIQDGVTGRILPNFSARDSARALQAMLEDEKWRREARAKAPVFVRDKFHLKKMLERMSRFYQDHQHPQYS